jgi:hypothetical protein
LLPLCFPLLFDDPGMSWEIMEINTFMWDQPAGTPRQRPAAAGIRRAAAAHAPVIVCDLEATTTSGGLWAKSRPDHKIP